MRLAVGLEASSREAVREPNGGLCLCRLCLPGVGTQPLRPARACGQPHSLPGLCSWLVDCSPDRWFYGEVPCSKPGSRPAISGLLPSCTLRDLLTIVASDLESSETLLRITAMCHVLREMAGFMTSGVCLVGVAVTRILEPATEWGNAVGPSGSAVPGNNRSVPAAAR